METVTKAKSSLTLSLKNKTNAVKTELIILSLLSRDKKTLLAAITKRLQALLGHQPKLPLPPPPPPPFDYHQLYTDQNVSTSWTVADPAHTEVVKPEEAVAVVAEQVQEIDCRKEREEEEEAETKEKKEEEEEEEEVVGKEKETRGLEEEIDKQAELFIERFHRQMRMQRLQSLEDELLFAPPQPL